MLLLAALMADSDTEGSKPDPEKVDEKIKASRNRKIPVVRFFLLLVVIILTAIVLEYFL